MNVLTATACAIACAVTLAAQSPDAQAQRKTTPASDERSVSVTGCLQAGDAADTFVLANVKLDTPAGTEKPAGTTGTPAIAQGASLRIVGAPASLELKNHVGHTVQLTGMIVPQGPKSPGPAGTTGALPPAAAPPTTTPPTEPPTPTPAPPAVASPSPAAPTADPQERRPERSGQAAMQSFNVKAMKHISGTCPPK